MDTHGLTIEPDTEPGALPVAADRLFRVPETVYRGMVEQGLFGADEVALVDGLLMSGEQLYRMPIDILRNVANLGLLGADDKVVLWDGLLVKKPPRTPSHVCSTHLTWDALNRTVEPAWTVFKGDPLALPNGPTGYDSEPEPDLNVVRGGIRDYLSGLPKASDAGLVIEVGEAFLHEDYQALVRYAWAGTPIAWIINLNERNIEVYANPTGPVAPAGYQEMTAYRDGDEIPVVLDGRAVGRLAAVELLP
jgi:Putative restriction endonuclease